MRKSWKKFLALACAATMLIPYASPMTALADLGDSYLGEGAIEMDNSQLNITNVVLSTITEATYDFRVDPDQILKEFDSDLYANATMYFQNTKPNAAGTTLQLPTGSTSYSFYIRSMVEYEAASSPVDSVTDFVALAVAGNTIESFETALNNGAYYVWQPMADMSGLGEYVQITSDNYVNFITITPDATDATKIGSAKADVSPKMSEGDVYAIWDGKIYTPKYTVQADDTTIVPLFDNNTWTFDESVYVGLTSAPTAYYNAITVSDVDQPSVDTSTGEVVVKYTAPVSQYQGTSLPASIVNKSNFDIAVTASVQVVGGEGLNFVYAGDGTAAYTDVDFSDTNAGDATNNKGAGSESKANVALVIANATDATNKQYAPIIEPATAKTTTNADEEVVNVTAEASAYYVLKGNDANSIVYTLGEKDEATYGNIYYRYYSSEATSNTASFVIAGITDTRAYTASTLAEREPLLDAWEDYIEDLTNGVAKRPQINVVYEFSKVESSRDSDGAIDNLTFTDLDTNTYATADSSAVTTAAWVKMTAGNKTAGLDNTTYTYTYGDEIDVTYYPANAELLYVELDNQGTEEFTVTDNVITLNALNSWLVEKAAETTTGSTVDVTLKVVFADPTDEVDNDGDGIGEATYTATITVTGTKAP